jgi:hypothetical protein
MPKRRWTKYLVKKADPTSRAMSRLERDSSIVREVCPSLVFSCDLAARELQLAGPLRLIESVSGQPTDIELRVAFPSSYPRDEPTTHDARGFFRVKSGKSLADRHINQHDASFCLWLAPLSRWDGSDQEALRIYLERVIVFCEDQMTYDVTGRFSKGEWAHGNAGYAQFLFESLDYEPTFLDTLSKVDPARWPARNGLCVCGSGVKFKKCHMDSLTDALTRIGIEHFRSGLSAWRANEHNYASSMRKAHAVRQAASPIFARAPASTDD